MQVSPCCWCWRCRGSYHRDVNEDARRRSQRCTEVSIRIRAPRESAYRACLDPAAVALWRVPDTMSAHVHAFDAREGGSYRMSLVYQDSDHPVAGKTSEDTDAFQGTFVELVPNERIVEVIEFESDDSSVAGRMTLTTSFADADGGMQVTMVFEDVPAGISLADNELGTRQALEQLASYLRDA